MLREGEILNQWIRQFTDEENARMAESRLPSDNVGTRNLDILAFNPFAKLIADTIEDAAEKARQAQFDRDLKK